MVTNFSAISFPEAASKAYILRGKKGLDWEIISIEKEVDEAGEEKPSK